MDLTFVNILMTSMQFKVVPVETSNISIVNVQRWLIISVGVYMVLVLNLFEPFGIRTQVFIPALHLMLSSYGLVSALAVWLWLRCCPDRWSLTVVASKPWSLVTWVVALVCWVSFSNWAYSQLLHHTISGWHHMSVPIRSFRELMPQFLSLYALWGMACVGFIHLLVKQRPATGTDGGEMVLLPSDNQSDGFKVKPAHLVCLKTSDNYLDVYYLNEQAELQHRMIRSSMKKMAQQLNTELFYRSHQSYLVNLAYVKGLKKLQNKHFLEMAYLDFDVAISRKNVKHIKAEVVN